MKTTSILTLALLLAGCTVNQSEGSFLCQGLADGGSGGGGSDSGSAIPIVDACTIHACDLAPVAKQKADCDDGDPQTADRCVQITPDCDGTVCAHVEVQCDHYDSAEIQLALCDDGDECSSDRCSDNNACIHSPIANCL
jgi:hypothetical protein